MPSAANEQGVGGWSERKAVRVRAKKKAKGQELQRQVRKDNTCE